jgi:ribonucleoside-triphosphate reductase (thioredoxin)
MCTLVETYIGRHESLEDFKKTLKVSYLYAKTVTLLPTHWQRTNAIMQRNRRIGTSMSGIANFADNHGVTKLREWMDRGYATVQHYDEVYSEWLCVRESIKTTTVKPSGTVSILAGESPGVHWGPGGEFFDRGIVFSENDPMVPLLRWAGYKVEDSAYTKGSVFVQFPIHSSAKRSEGDVTLFEKASLAALAQRYWSDNSVSVTLSFDKETEAQHVATVLHMHEGDFKTVSFLPKGNETYLQMPYQQIDRADYEEAELTLLRMDLSGIYDGLGVEAIGEMYCTTDACEIKTVTDAAKLEVLESVTVANVA